MRQSAQFLQPFRLSTLICWAYPVRPEVVSRLMDATSMGNFKMIARRSRALAEGEGPGAAGPSDHPAKILGFPPGSQAFGWMVPRGCRSGSGVLLGSGFEFDFGVMPAQPQKKFYL